MSFKKPKLRLGFSEVGRAHCSVRFWIYDRIFFHGFNGLWLADGKICYTKKKRIEMKLVFYFILFKGCYSYLNYKILVYNFSVLLYKGKSFGDPCFITIRKEKVFILMQPSYFKHNIILYHNLTIIQSCSINELINNTVIFL